MALKTLFTRASPKSLNEKADALVDDNTHTRQRNLTIFGIVLTIAGLSYLAFDVLTTPEKNVTVAEPHYEPVITPDFTGKDSQSALQAQQQTISQLQNQLDKLQRQRDRLSDQLEQGMTALENRLTASLEDVERNWNNQLDAMQSLPSHVASANGRRGQPFDPFGALDGDEYREEKPGYTAPDLRGQPATPRRGIQTYAYQWPTRHKESYRRTSQNYVPTGSFVTAVLIGAADANAGVNAQGDTAPILFRAIHNGILPNGKQSRLNHCFFTASVYGEISSNRGIARLQNMSCIFDNDGQEDILDIPVRGTAFNFGRNGIRGTPVMRNGNIIQMAGISGLFTGLGNTAKAASATTITGPAGVVSSVTPSKALLNMSGSALESVGAKLSDYYIKLAEQYHPIIELNPGSVVNLVFLEGFPLDASKIAQYEAKLDRQQGKADRRETATQLMSHFSNPFAPLNQRVTPHNPLLKQLPQALQPSVQAFEQTGQSAPVQSYGAVPQPY
ncbi:TrbI/VirB10 family protein [Photobacterium leiognathi]|uniref:TrbI/VirB10 family protein n=1 Tax=Photobacterium leiognathi TaxID=553611 RepID=UPI002159748C|nr:TrbI/VirB10 family protein [Photobacterium leiognathi]